MKHALIVHKMSDLYRVRDMIRADCRIKRIKSGVIEMYAGANVVVRYIKIKRI